MSKRVTIIDYGMGNLHSVVRAFDHIGATVTVSDKPEKIERSEYVVLPGVGAFGDGMRELRERGLTDALREHVGRGKPFLGICLGMQMMLDTSEEFGEHEGLALISGRVVPIPATTRSGSPRKVPHVGWNELIKPGADRGWKGTILDGVKAGASVYFVHSYAAVPEDDRNRLADCCHDGFVFSAVIRRDNAYGCQFHPEKSGPIGIDILRKFIS